MRKRRNNKGFTLAEMLVVVAITIILMGVAFIAVQRYQRSMTRLEYDAIAKEIFIAAQNHLTTAGNQGYMNMSGDTALGIKVTTDYDKEDERFFVYNAVHTYSSTQTYESVLDLMLPFGSIDETVRAGGRYIIRYQPSSGRVLDVFYSLPGKSSILTLTGVELGEEDYASLMTEDYRSTTNPRPRETYTAANGTTGVVGWYGGEEGLPIGKRLVDPELIIHNEDKLWVEVRDNNTGTHDLKLIVTGATSGAKKAFDLSITSSDPRVEGGGVNPYKVTLDDITTQGMHFYELAADTGMFFIPGEDLIIEAVAYNNNELTNIAYSGKKTTNSLFASIADMYDGSGNLGTDEVFDTAYISSIRHLENLSRNDISVMGPNPKLNINHAEQITDLSWKEFQKNITGTVDGTVSVYYYNNFTWKPTKLGGFKPIIRQTLSGYSAALQYDGNGHSISDIKVESEDSFGSAGLFGVCDDCVISNLELVDFTITGTNSAGALAGTLSDCTVTNVLARNSEGASTKTITAPTAGGLIGTMVSGTRVQYSAASVLVNGTTTAGGLIGSAEGTITGCYSGGHTKDGSYELWLNNATPDDNTDDHPYDVTGTTTGGLIGNAGSAEISNSYSTCSVSGTTAGGFAGSASGSITNCYATGLVSGTTKYAFLADGTPTLSGNYYYMTINEVPSTKPNAKPDETEPMLPYSGYALDSNLSNMKPIDLNAGTYNGFTGEWNSWNPASAYDSALVNYYSGKYTLKTVDELIGAVQTTPTDTPDAPTGYNNWNEIFVSTHYGDWPSPEVFFINTSA